MLSIVVLLALVAGGLAVASASTKVPLWPAVFVLALLELIQVWTVR